MKINEQFIDDIDIKDAVNTEVDILNSNNYPWNFKFDCEFSKPSTLDYKQDVLQRNLKRIKNMLDCSLFCKNYEISLKTDDFNEPHLIVNFDGKFHSVIELFSAVSFLFINNIRVIIIRQRGIDEFYRLNHINNIYNLMTNKQSFASHTDVRFQLCGFVEFMMPGDIKAIEKLFEIIKDNNEYDVTSGVMQYVLLWDYFRQNPLIIPFKIRREIRKSKLDLFSSSSIYMVYSSVRGVEEQKIAEGDDETALKACFLDAHLNNNFKIGVDIEEGIGVLYGWLGLAHWRTDQNYPCVDDVVVCCIGDIKNDEFKENLHKFLPDTPIEVIDKIDMALKDQFENRYNLTTKKEWTY